MFQGQNDILERSLVDYSVIQPQSIAASLNYNNNGLINYHTTSDISTTNQTGFGLAILRKERAWAERSNMTIAGTKNELEERKNLNDEVNLKPLECITTKTIN